MALFKEVKERFGLLELHKDDSITPALMILCCQRLLTRIDKLDRVRKHNHNHNHNSPLLDMALFKEVKERFGLLELHKNDSITPALMILCCQRLLTRIDKLDRRLLTRIDKLDRVRKASMKQVASVNQWTFATFKEVYAVWCRLRIASPHISCQRLLTRIDKLDRKLQGNILYITHYYSVLSEGALCIPWNFK
ncbi:hypothetical protein NE865_11110 [Phthorimaea operculella]|nr:hypothetical protein NE865_11110 [Phthorimaea operculella]